MFTKEGKLMEIKENELIERIKLNDNEITFFNRYICKNCTPEYLGYNKCNGGENCIKMKEFKGILLDRENNNDK